MKRDGVQAGRYITAREGRPEWLLTIRLTVGGTAHQPSGGPQRSVPGAAAGPGPPENHKWPERSGA